MVVARPGYSEAGRATSGVKGRNTAPQALRSQVQVVQQHTSSSPLHTQHETHPHRLRTAIVSTLRAEIHPRLTDIQFSRVANRSSCMAYLTFSRLLSDFCYRTTSLILATALWSLFWAAPSSPSVNQCTAAAECMYSNDNGQSNSAFDSDNRVARAAHSRLPPGFRPQPRQT
ncbi:hypothetical protein B0H13DRAFT_544143 [Mycena leptocephala]|nr:hypothetical protein B0H13DRAFT_544143 [Mycena leptocephala]